MRRRNSNIRKRKINIQLDNKQVAFICIFIVLVLTLIFLTTTVLGRTINKSNLENSFEDFANKNQKTIFSIDKCVFFSNCNADTSNSSINNINLKDLYQYTDMAIFINNNSKNYSLENTLKSVKINNVKYLVKPTVGKQHLYYKNINSFAEGFIPNDENLINNELIFNISSKDNEDLKTPTLYNNCANPITLSYINNEIKTDYTIDSSNPITYDGSLLKTCNVLLSSLNSKLSFDIYITNNLYQEFKCTVFIDIPLENKEKTIYEGAIKVESTSNFKFIRYK